jgi:hypothetical protein
MLLLFGGDLEAGILSVVPRDELWSLWGVVSGSGLGRYSQWYLEVRWGHYGECYLKVVLSVEVGCGHYGKLYLGGGMWSLYGVVCGGMLVWLLGVVYGSGMGRHWKLSFKLGGGGIEIATYVELGWGWNEEWVAYFYAHILL